MLAGFVGGWARSAERRLRWGVKELGLVGGKAVAMAMKKASQRDQRDVEGSGEAVTVEMMWAVRVVWADGSEVRACWMRVEKGLGGEVPGRSKMVVIVIQ